jgi:hypothetical protein
LGAYSAARHFKELFVNLWKFAADRPDLAGVGSNGMPIYEDQAKLGYGAQKSIFELGMMALPMIGPEASLETTLGEVGEGTTLYRAVLNPELANIQSTGAYRLAPGMGNVKGFFPTASQASNFARLMFRSFPAEGTYTLTSTTVPTASLPGVINVFGEGPAYFLSSSMMPLGPVTVYPWMVIP